MSTLQDSQKGIIFDALFAIAFLIFVHTPAMAVLGGWILTKLWAWFIVPFGIVQVGLFHAVGLMFLVGFFSFGKFVMISEIHSKINKLNNDSEVKSPTAAIIGRTLGLTVGYFILLFFAWLVQLCM